MFGHCWGLVTQLLTRDETDQAVAVENQVVARCQVVSQRPKAPQSVDLELTPRGHALRGRPHGERRAGGFAPETLEPTRLSADRSKVT